ncbi:hypothetical protein [Microbacterium paraoxydans]|uniref:hypothetical protein n=1 Tax=Microbacterium paraoxydans TaxID=199592 RepID=UPI001CF9EE26|nr:hypothetical protein [Microbacterium paraoxydans]
MSTELPEPDVEVADFGDDDGVLYDEDVTPEYGILGFTLRELLIVSVWLVSFVVSFFPLAGGASLWAVGIQWILPVGLPTVAVFLLVLRRFSPEGIRRVGSLGIDQFASVAFSVAAVVWAGNVWLTTSGLIATGFWSLPWNGVVMAVTSLALVVLTVFAPLIPGLKEDFHGRLVTLAHRNANPVRPVIARPRPEPVAAEPVDESAVPSIEDADGETPETHATDEVDRVDLAAQVPLTAHASGGDIGTVHGADEEEYVPTYSRRSRAQDPEIVSDTGSIESLLETAATSETVVVPDDTEAPIVEGFADADLDATNPRESTPVAQPFWILAPSERDVHDERGDALFRIGPNAWALVIEDRGGAYVVRHDDGRIGYLHDISDITKG